MAEPATEDRDGRLKRARRRVESTRHGLTERATQIEEHVPAARAAVRAYEHDRMVGGEIMAGAIAFRLFVYVLPLVLVFVSALGFAAHTSGETPQKVAKSAGITGIAAQSITDSARVSNGSRWIALVLGLIALYSTSIALARAVRIAHALAWGKPVAPMKRPWRAGLIVVGAAIAMAFVVSTVSRLNASNRAAGLVVALLAIVVYGGAWLALSYLLPHDDVHWTALIPGAILVGLGVQVLHLVTVYYVSGKVSSSSALYGPMGAAVAILGWAYLCGRLVVASAVLNASLHRKRNDDRQSGFGEVLA